MTKLTTANAELPKLTEPQLLFDSNGHAGLIPYLRHRKKRRQL